ncbi:DUF1878 family protein [Bacillus thermocopriae]|uniref:DUF1878 family protein n=1 Tax=Neobacillus thermocopriae TaxID=1215031 RepID=A0A6B3TSK7_9BACI|nr:DUF1878 family protein [Neobacillus thermocopriae]
MDNPHFEFYRLIIEHGVSKEEIDSVYSKFSQLCKKMNSKKRNGIYIFIRFLKNSYYLTKQTKC